MNVLNLYAGIGGNRKLWTDCNVTAVEWDEATADVYKDYFPDDEVIVTDAHEYLLNHYKEYDFIWTSPPCPTHSILNRSNHGLGRDIKYPDMKLYQEIIFLQQWYNGKYCVENVKPYYEPLIAPEQNIHRHLYWANFKLAKFDGYDKSRIHTEVKRSDTLYGFNVMDSEIDDKRKALRNMVDPKLGNYIFNRAKDITIKSDTTQKNMKFS